MFTLLIINYSCLYPNAVALIRVYTRCQMINVESVLEFDKVTLCIYNPYNIYTVSAVYITESMRYTVHSFTCSLHKVAEAMHVQCYNIIYICD